MNAGKITVIETNFPQLRPICINQVDYTVRQPGFLQNFHKHVALKIWVSAGFQTTTFPHIAADVGRFPPIAVKLNGVMANYKSFQRTVFHPVMHAGMTDGLLSVYFA